MENFTKVLSFALENYPEKIDIAPVEKLITDSARQNQKRPAYIKLAVPDEVVQALRGPQNATQRVFLVRLPKDLLDRAESPIVLPGEKP
jgi:hypothetical protein